MLHAAVREELFCPASCLMPDHLHLIWMGMRRESDQLNGIKFLRTHVEPALGGVREWQHQPHDHVLREKERICNAFANSCFYTLANPVRAELVKSERGMALQRGYCSMLPDASSATSAPFERRCISITCAPATQIESNSPDSCTQRFCG